MEYSATAWRGQSLGWMASANWRRVNEGLDDNERATDWLWLPLCLQENASAWMVTWGTRFTSTSAFAASGAPTRGELRQSDCGSTREGGNVWRIVYDKEEIQFSEDDVWGAITWKRSWAIMSWVFNVLTCSPLSTLKCCFKDTGSVICSPHYFTRADSHWVKSQKLFFLSVRVSVRSLLSHNNGCDCWLDAFHQWKMLLQVHPGGHRDA